MDGMPDPDELAGRYFDLWQRQLEILSGTGPMAETAARTLGLLGAMTGFPGPTGSGGGTNDANAGAAPAAASPGGSDHDLGELARRAGELEKRFARLESGIDGGSGRSGKGDRGSRS